MDDGFLAGRPLVGFGWLAVIAVSVVIGAAGTRRAYGCLADLVEPFRDALVRRVVAGAVRRATAAGPRVGTDSGAVARLTHQVEIVRDTFAGLVMTVRAFAFSVGGGAARARFAGADRAVRGAAVAAARADPVRPGRCRPWPLASASTPGRGSGSPGPRRRRSAGCGTSPRAVPRIGSLRSVGRHVDAQAGAERSLARMSAVRDGERGGRRLAAGAAAARRRPWLVEQGVTPGGILGALAYVLTVLQPALHTLVRGVGGGGLRFVITLDRLLHADDPPAPEQERPPSSLATYLLDGGAGET